MGNTNKALIIAASVLFALLVISLGEYIYSQSSESENAESTIADMEAMTRNKQYELYSGIRSGGEVKRLLKLAADNNQELYKSQDTIKSCVCICTNVDSILKEFANDGQMKAGLNGSRSYGVRYPSNIYQIADCISIYQKYNVRFSYNEYGYIWEINIENVDGNK